MLGDNILSIEELQKLSTINVISYVNRVKERRRIIFQSQQEINPKEKKEIDDAYNEAIKILTEKTRGTDL